MCERQHVDSQRESLSCARSIFVRKMSMERLMFVWDELDDLIGASSRMLAIAAVSMWQGVISRR